MNTVIVIPARLASTRLPGKPLIDICGKTMIERTFEQCSKVFPQEKIYVATESTQIYDHCNKLSINVIMTSDSCLTGTDRIAEVSNIIDADIYINVQGDEPLINPDDILKIISQVEAYPDSILNGYAEINNETDYQSRTIPKVVFREDKRLLYMSRSPIPGNKSNENCTAYRQICIYAFPKMALRAFAERGEKTRFESIEDIEILRFLEMGYDVQMIEMSGDSIAVDTVEDLEKVKTIIKNAEQ